MQIFKSLALAAVISVLGSVSSAQNIVASDPGVLMTFFSDQGVPTKLSKDDYGDPKLDLRYYGTKFQIFYYGCTNGEN